MTNPTELEHTGTWVPVSKLLPKPYRDVPILLRNNSQRVGRINRAGYWELASYQVCKHQYMSSDVVAWFDTPRPGLGLTD